MIAAIVIVVALSGGNVTASGNDKNINAFSVQKTVVSIRF